jgi:antitoxin HigA-1
MKTKITNPAVSLLRDELEARAISQAAASAAMAIPRSRLTDIIHGRKRISVDTALRLERFLGIRAALWLGLQQDYELAHARIEMIRDIEAEVTPAAC